ncbi:MAG: hypothetical protein EBV86_08220 [Marivivens sp.]|nr:hypothetical protein [Marivivens sp.]
MSSYVQPVLYSDGTVLKSSDIISNEESLKEYVNQEIVAADLSTGKMKQEDIARGSIVRNAAEFVSCHISGLSVLRFVLNRSYNTSTTKNNSQTASIQWQDLSNSGCIVSAHSNALAIITMYIQYFMNDNTTTTSNGGQGSGLWQNEIQLKRVNVETGEVSRYANTDNYCFEGAGSSLDTLDPGGDLENAAARSLMTAVRVSLTPGEYYFCATVNPHNEMGYSTVKSITAEVFYI